MIDVGRIRATTQGEKLFQLLAAIGEQQVSKVRAGDHAYIKVAGRDDFGSYVEGAVIGFALRRVLKAASGIFEEHPDDADRHNRLRGMLGTWFRWLPKEEVAKLSRQAFHAQEASHRPISTSEFESTLGIANRFACCFCGVDLLRKSAGVIETCDGEKADLEHVWPASLGGDSIKANLIPACCKCNSKKADLFLWQHGPVHDDVYPIGFEKSSFYEKLPRKYKILLQRRAVMALAARERITLKSALLRVGPYSEMRAIDCDDTWDFFNLQNHYDRLGERMW
jgi:5-methylcytosine-specific restriction endonuclease McrA